MRHRGPVLRPRCMRPKRSQTQTLFYSILIKSWSCSASQGLSIFQYHVPQACHWIYPETSIPTQPLSHCISPVSKWILSYLCLCHTVLSSSLILHKFHISNVPATYSTKLILLYQITPATMYLHNIWNLNTREKILVKKIKYHILR